jgi:hypothetical protein
LAQIARDRRTAVAPPYQYRVFGLVLASEFELAALSDLELSTPGGPDVTIRRAARLGEDVVHTADPFFDIRPERQYFHWAAVGHFLIETPNQIDVLPHDGVSDHLISQPLLGIVMSVLLERRGTLCLHASAVDIGGRAALFLGDKGAGKSTLLSALVQAGHTPLTDDLVAVTQARDAVDTLVIQPGYARVKLWPDSLSALDLPSSSSDAPVHPSISKMQKSLPQSVAAQEVALRCGFVLDRQDSHQETRAVRLSPHDTLQVLLSFAFMARYGETRLGQLHLIEHMKRCSALVARAPIFRLEIKPDLDDLPGLVAAVSAAVDNADREA